MMRKRGLRLAGVALLAALLPRAGGAQTAPPRGGVSPGAEARLLREASSHEWRGDLERAEGVLRDVLARNPTSPGGLFALERILRTRSRVAETLPYIDRFLAEEPGATGPRYMRIRVLVEADSLGGLERAGEEWFRAAPGDPEPYREMARVYLRHRGPERALEVLEAGRAAVGSAATLALEMGDALAALGDEEGAAREWARALQTATPDVEGVLLRVQRLEGDRERLAEPVLAALTGSGADEAQRGAAVRLAIALELPDLAGRVAVAGLGGLSARAAPPYLREVASRAEEAGMAELSLWALEALQRSAPGTAGDAGVEARLAAQALVVGDTAAALAAHRRQVQALRAATPGRRRAWAELIRLEAVAGGVAPGAAARSLADFAREFPDADEVDDLTARAAGGVAAAGDLEGALRLVADPIGPESRLERGWILLEMGERAEGRAALTASVPGLAPAEATSVIQLLAVLGRVGAPTADAFVASGILLRRGDLPGARRAVETAAEVASGGDRATLLFQAGALALTAADTAAAREHYARIEGAHFASPESPEAMLRHARLLAADPARADEARSLLERLILERPGAAVVPDARQELNRLGRGR